MENIQMHLSQKQNTFSQFYSAFFESALNFEPFQKKMTLIAYVFRNYRPRKTCLDKCLKTPVWEDVSTGDMVNRLKHWFNLNESAFIILSDHCEGNWVAKSLLDTWNIFIPLLNTLTADDKYSLISKEKWMQTIQMHLSQKQNIFSQFFSAFFESALNFKNFQ